MHFSELMKTIKTELKPLYLFTGEEGGIISIYVKQLAEFHKLQVRKFNSAADYFIYKQSAGGFIEQEKVVAVIIDDMALAKEEALWEKLKQTGDAVVLVYFKFDKRLKIFKHFENELYEFSKLTAEQLANYIMKICGITQQNAVYLAELCGRDYLQCINESEKIKAYGGDNPNDAFMVLQTRGQIGAGQDENIFEVINLFMARQEKETLTKLNNMTSDNVMGFITLLFRAFKNLLIVETDGGKGVCERTGITPWEAKNASAWRGNYGIKEIKRAMKVLQAVDENIKFGKLDADIALDYIYINII